MTHRPFVRAAAWVALALLATHATELGQAQQVPTFKSGTALLTIDVAVFDDKGRPVPGLGPDAFEVKLDGRVQPVRLATFVEARGEQEPATAGTAPTREVFAGRPGRQTISNAGVEGPKAARGEDRVFVILIDNLSFPATYGQRLFMAAQKFVAALPASDPVAVVHTADPSKPVGPTLDRAVIANALSEIRGSAVDLLSLQIEGEGNADNPFISVGIHQALEIDSGNLEVLKEAIAQSCFSGDRSAIDSQVLDVVVAQNQCAGRVQRNARLIAAQAKQIRANQVSATAGVMKGMGSASGIRHLIILSAGIPVGREADSLRPVAEAAARAGIQVSVLMEEHDLNVGDLGNARDKAPTRGARTFGPGDTGTPQRRIEDQRLLQAGLQTATGLTGGQFYRVVGDPAPFFERVRTASAAIYRLGIEPPPGLPPGRSVSVEAKVLRPNVSSFVNRHAFVPEPAAAPPKTLSTEDKLRAAVSSGEQHGAVPLEVATLLRRATGPSGQLELTLSLDVSAPAGGRLRGPVIAMFGLVPTAGVGSNVGAAMNSGRRVLDAPNAAGGFSASLPIPVAPGLHKLRVAVADAEGALGSIETELDATLPVIGPFSASDLIIGWVDGGGRAHPLALESMPTASTGVRAELELYPPASGVSLDTVQVEFVLMRAGQTDPVDERAVTPRDTSGVWRAGAEFSAADLQPGRYTLRANVIVGDKTVGSTLAMFVRTQ